MPIEGTQENLEKLIEDNAFVIIDFWAEWCGPCKAFAPVFDEAAKKNEDITFVKVDTEAQQQLAHALQIRSIPTLMVFRDQVLLYAEAGALPPAAFDELIGKVRELDMAEVKKEIAAQEQAQA